MTHDIPNSVFCGGCHSPLPEDPSEPSGRVPCPACGATARIFDEYVRERVMAEVPVHGLTAGKRGGRTKSGRRQIEFKSGDSFTTKTKRWAWLERRFDRTDPDPANWQYCEWIVDQETGEVLHFVCEPLIKHQRHGSDKGRPDH
jgi:hypothetical protein